MLSRIKLLCPMLLFFGLSLKPSAQVFGLSATPHCFSQLNAPNVNDLEEMLSKVSTMSDFEESLRARIRSTIQQVNDSRRAFSETLADVRRGLAQAFNDHLHTSTDSLGKVHDRLREVAREEGLRAIERQSLSDDQFLIALSIALSYSKLYRDSLPSISEASIQRLLRIAQSKADPTRQTTALRMISFMDIQSESVDQTIRSIFLSTNSDALVLSEALEIYESKAAKGEDLNNEITLSLSSHALRIWKQRLAKWRDDTNTSLDLTLANPIDEDFPSYSFRGNVFAKDDLVVFKPSSRKSDPSLSRAFSELLKTTLRLASYQAEDPRYQNIALIRSEDIQEIVSSAIKDKMVPSSEAFMIFNTIASYSSFNVIRDIVQRHINNVNLESQASRVFVTTIVREYIMLAGPNADPRAIALSNQLSRTESPSTVHIELLTATMGPETNHSLEVIRHRQPSLSQTVDQALELLSYWNKPLAGQDLNSLIALASRQPRTLSLRSFMPQLLNIVANPAETYARRRLALSAFYQGNWPTEELREALTEVIANEAASMKPSEWNEPKGAFVNDLIDALPIAIWNFSKKQRITLGIL